MKNFKFKKILLPALLIVIIFLSYLNFHASSKKDQMTRYDVITTNQEGIKENSNLTIKEEQIKPDAEHRKTSDFIILNVLGENYQAPFENGDSVFDIMNKIKSNKENNFDFKYKEYPSLGVFVSEINGVGGGSNKYWIYYVNGKEAEIGIAKYLLKSGDIISWNQESQ